MPESFRVPRRGSGWVRGAAVGLGLVAFALAARTTATSLAWVGRTFPGFVVIENRTIAAIGLPDWTGTAVPGLHLNEIVAVDGRPPATAAEVSAHAASLPPGTPVTYQIRQGDREREVAVATQTFAGRHWAMLFGAYLFNGVVFLGAGLLAWVLRPGSPLTHAFLAFGASAALFLFTAMDLYGPSDFFHLHLLAETLVPAAALQLLLLFPQEHHLARFRFAGYPVALVLFALLELFAGRPPAFLAVFQTTTLFLASMGLLFGLRQVLEYLHARSPLARQRVRIVTLSTLVGVTLPGLVFLVSLSLGHGLGMNAIVFTFFLFPVGLAYAIVKHDFFEIDAMVKRGAYYLLLTGAVGLAYAGAVFVLNLGLQRTDLARSPAFAVLFTVGVLALFNPLRNRLQAFLDRAFFRTAYDGAQVLADVGGTLASALRHDEIRRLVEEGVARATPNLGTHLFFAAGETGELRDIGSGEALPDALRRHLEAGRILTVEDPVELYSGAAAHREVQSALVALGAELAVPLRLRGQPVGVLAVGRKLSGLFYTAGDAEFLRALAHQAAIALENARSYEALVRLNAELEDRVRQRTAELASANVGLSASNQALERAYADLKSAEVQLVQSEKMASLGKLAAGVAHEINNPVSFIASNIEPLRSRLQRVAQASPEDAQMLLGQAQELIGIMAKGAERTVAIVKDLRSFSRLNEAARKAVDLREGLDVSIRLLETRWRDRIAIHREYEAVPPVECEAGQLNQVFMNVLSNACEAIDGRGGIRVGLRRNGDAADEVMQVYDLLAGKLISTGQAAVPCAIPGCEPGVPYRIRATTEPDKASTVSFLTRELDQGGADLDGNGFGSDTVVQVFNVVSLTTQVFSVTTDEAGSAAPSPFPDDLLDDPILYVTAREDEAGRDLDGDGVITPGRVVTLVVGDQDEDGSFNDASSAGGDSCVEASNADQVDSDLDGIGDACDASPYCSSFTPTAPPLAPGAAVKCQKAIGTAAAAYLRARAKASAACLKDLARGKIAGDATTLCRGSFVAGAEVPPTHAKTAERIAKGEAKLRAALASRCAPAALALLDTCASPPAAPTLESLGSCLVQTYGAAVLGVSRLASGALAPIADPKERRCALVVGDASAGYLVDLVKAMGTCLDRANDGDLAGAVQALCLGRGDELSGSVVPPMDAKVRDKLGKAEEKLLSRVTGACPGALLAEPEILACADDPPGVSRCTECSQWRRAVESLRAAYGPSGG